MSGEEKNTLLFFVGFYIATGVEGLCCVQDENLKIILKLAT